jgi:hypothetical protein
MRRIALLPPSDSGGQRYWLSVDRKTFYAKLTISTPSGGAPTFNRQRMAGAVWSLSQRSALLATVTRDWADVSSDFMASAMEVLSAELYIAPVLEAL